MQWIEISSQDTRYVYPTGRIRGLERYLLKTTDFVRIKEGKNLQESFQTLSRFYPYSDSMKVCKDAGDFEEGLEEEWRRIYLELRSFAPEPELVDLFWLEQDFHNLKVLLKIRAQQKDLQEIEKIDYLFRAGTLNPDILKDAVFKEDFFYLPPFFKGLIQEVLGMIEKGESGREIDIFLDREHFLRFSFSLSQYKDEFLKELARRTIDSYNIETFLRIKFWNREDEKKLLEECLIEGGGISKDRLAALAEEPVESLLDALRESEYKVLFQRVLEEWKEKRTLFKLEELIKNILLNFTYRGFYITFGREPLINYILLKKWEIKTLRSILGAKKANLSWEEMEKIGV
jgi:V/A-type H+-transporting ATPase subunit C